MKAYGLRQVPAGPAPVRWLEREPERSLVRIAILVRASAGPCWPRVPVEERPFWRSRPPFCDRRRIRDREARNRQRRPLAAIAYYFRRARGRSPAPEPGGNRD